jgi:hypothetical protein
VNDLEKASHPGRALAEAMDEGKVRMSAILEAVGIKANDPVHQAALLACEMYDLDPLRKEVIVIPRGGPYVTRDGYLRVAHRSGQLDGIVVLEESETPTHWEAKVAVHRKDMTHPFTYVGRYPKSGTNKAYGREMAITRAERTALARAFPVAGMVPGGEDMREQVMAARASEIDAELSEQTAVTEWVKEMGPSAIDVGEITHEAIDEDGEMFPT